MSIEVGPGIDIGPGILIGGIAPDPLPTPVLYLDATDYSGSGTTWTAQVGNNGTLFNSPTYTAAAPTYFRFDRASTQYASVPDLGDLNTWTVEAWFRLTTTLTTGTSITAVLCNQYNLATKLNFSIGSNRQPSSANICVGFFDGTWRTTAGFTAAANTWYHVVGTYDGTTVRQYLDGSEQSILTYSGTPQSGGEIRIARRWDQAAVSDNYLPGDVGLVRVWNTAFSAAEVQDLYDQNAARFNSVVTDNLVLSLDAALYSGSGNWLDTSGNNNDATLVGTPTYTASGGSYFTMDGGSSTGPGTNDAFQVADSATLDSMTAISFEAWFRIDSFQQAASPNLLFGKRGTTSNGYVGFFTSTGYTFRVGTASPSQLGYASAPPLNTWQQLVVTVSSGGSKVYINGSEVVNSAYTGNFNNINTATALQICDLSIAASGVYAFRGDIGVFRIYSKALDSTEVLTNYNAVAARYGL